VLSLRSKEFSYVWCLEGCFFAAFSFGLCTYVHVEPMSVALGLVALRGHPVVVSIVLLRPLGVAGDVVHKLWFATC